VLEHTADVGFEAFGQTREEVFVNAARALTDLMVDAAEVRPAAAVPIEATAASETDLVVNWLSEVLYLFDAERWLFSGFEISRLTMCSLAAVGRGEKFDPARHAIKLQVKAITYHQLALEHGAGGWRVQVYVDI